MSVLKNSNPISNANISTDTINNGKRSDPTDRVMGKGENPQYTRMGLATTLQAKHVDT